MLVGSVVTRFVNEAHAPARLREQALVGFGYTFTDAGLCRAAVRPARPVLAAKHACGSPCSPRTGLLADGCGPLVGSKVTTVDVPYERRTWQLDRLATQRSTAAVFSRAGPGFCRVAWARFPSCERRGDLAVVRYPSQPTLNVLALLDMSVRPFGSDCVVAGFECSSGSDTRRRFPIDRGAVSAGDRTAIRASIASVEPR